MRANEELCESEGDAAFTNQRVSINTLKKAFYQLHQKITDHLLRATAITRMLTSGVEEKIITETSGHRSTKALRTYEHTSEQQRKRVTHVINQTDMCSPNVAEIRLVS